MSPKIVIVILLRLTIARTAPMQMPLLQQLQGLTQQPKQLLQMILPQPPLQEAMQQPTKIPLLQPLQGTVQQQQLALQEQMFALQQFQALQTMGFVPSPMVMNAPSILVLYPNNEPNMPPMALKTNSLNHHRTDEQMGDEDSEVIDAEPTDEKIPQVKAVLLMPNTRGIIGDLISQIPFLPIEINVPDSISWIYNGIAGIIAGIGQRLPLRPQKPSSEIQNEENLKSIWKRRPENMPIMVLPLGR